MEIKILLRSVRKSKGMGQPELARRSNICQPAISKIETGGQVPQIVTLERLARALGVEASALYQIQEEPGDINYQDAPVVTVDL